MKSSFLAVLFLIFLAGGLFYLGGWLGFSFGLRVVFAAGVIALLAFIGSRSK